MSLSAKPCSQYGNRKSPKRHLGGFSCIGVTITTFATHSIPHPPHLMQAASLLKKIIALLKENGGSYDIIAVK